jgi:hypothetical protein
MIMDVNQANNPNAGVAWYVNLSPAAEMTGVTVKNAGTHAIWIHSTGLTNQSCCATINDSFIANSKGDGVYAENSSDVSVRTSQIEANGMQAVVSTSGSTVTYTSGTQWSTDSSLVNTHVILLSGGTFLGGVRLYTVTAVGSGTLTVTPAPGTASNVTLAIGWGIECNNSGACQVGASTDLSGNFAGGAISYGTTTGLGNASMTIGHTHSIGNNKGWDIVALCYDTVGGGTTGYYHNIYSNNFIGGTRLANNLFSEIWLQDCQKSTIGQNPFQGSNSAKSAIELTETAGSRAGPIDIGYNAYNFFSTQPVIDSVVNVSFLLSTGKPSSQGVIGFDSSNNLLIGADSTQKFIQIRPSGIGSATGAMSITAGGTTTFSGSIIPASAGCCDIGNSGTGWRQLWMSAGANLFNFVPVNPAATRVVNIPDPGATVNLGFNFSATSAAFAPGLLAAGVCSTQAATTVTGATTAMDAHVTPVSDPGTGLNWLGIIAAGTVSVRVCNTSTAGITPTSTTYNIRVTP